MTTDTREFRNEVAGAYELARSDPSNYTKIPHWEALPVDMRCAFISVYTAGAKRSLAMLEEHKKVRDSIREGSGV